MEQFWYNTTAGCIIFRVFCITETFNSLTRSPALPYTSSLQSTNFLFLTPQSKEEGKATWSHKLTFLSALLLDKPVCLEDQKTIYGVSEDETAHISCRVDSYPEAETFSWSFNTSSGGMDLSRDSFTNQGSSSLLSYTPKSQMDYGTVLCMAGNVVGRQIVPCIYHVIPAGKFYIATNFLAKQS